MSIQAGINQLIGQTAGLATLGKAAGQIKKNKKDIALTRENVEKYLEEQSAEAQKYFDENIQNWETPINDRMAPGANSPTISAVMESAKRRHAAKFDQRENQKNIMDRLEELARESRGGIV